MVGTIGSAGRATSWGHGARTWFVFLFFASVGGAVLGLTLGVLVWLGGAPIRWLAAAFVVIGLLAWLIGVHVQSVIPIRRQVSARMSWSAPTTAAAVWGTELGIGLSTRLPSWASVLWPATAIASGSSEAAIIGGCLFGVTRGLQFVGEPVMRRRLTCALANPTCGKGRWIWGK